ncbi:MAG TPA: GGDEF domain-containing protein [Nitrospiria bacterium]
MMDNNPKKPLFDEDPTLIKRNPNLDDKRFRKNHASLIVLKGAEIGRNFLLRKTRQIIGRSPEADIRLPDHGASREHARINYEGDVQNQKTTYIVTDLGSKNHTFVNSQPVKSAQLRDGDKIQIGETVLKFVVLDDIEAAFHAEVRDLITYDKLTGLLTKESLYLAFERELQRCLRYNLPLAVLMMDLDFFKSVNDQNGHLMGSHVLAEVGRLIRQSIRISNVSGRYGGEEFISYLAETDLEGGRLAAERIRAAIEAHPFTFDNKTIRVTISIGVSNAPGHGRDTKTLVSAADRALYRAKETGRNRVCTA